MKKFFSFAIVALMTGLLLCSCKTTAKDDAKEGQDKESKENVSESKESSKENLSKEDQFIADLKDVVNKLEAIPSDKFQTEGEAVANELVALADKYGLNGVNEPTVEEFKKAGFNVTEEQVKEIEDLVNKFQEIGMKKAQEAMGAGK